MAAQSNDNYDLIMKSRKSSLALNRASRICKREVGDFDTLSG